MPTHSMENLTESMFYVLMAFQTGSMCGVDVADFVRRHTGGRVILGPATLYTVLAKFQAENYIRELSADGRKRTYCMTQKGMDAYQNELERLRACLHDAEKGAVL
ncbi:MAG: helix-turn-helix transcriptional regulator [Clostridia bacterium]|nr:helix-turn-helix transcriptional regulator [Clostridia bacterium]